ncbi:unnamed protein product, partial [Soboliphyme baturini]|uniref:CUB domain-containing protein n=1 Tax=Soboliphyme baturini TaxID=241478 RepID=A0A183I9B0_9BILA
EPDGGIETTDVCPPSFDICLGDRAGDSRSEYFVFHDSGDDSSSMTMGAVDRCRVIDRVTVGGSGTFIVKFKSQNSDKLCQTELEAAERVEQPKGDGCTWPHGRLGSDALWNCQRLSHYIFPPTDCLDFSTPLWNSETSSDTENSGESCCRLDGNFYQDYDFEVSVDHMPVQQLDVWQKEDERDDDQLIRFVGSISLIAPLDPVSTISV